MWLPFWNVGLLDRKDKIRVLCTTKGAEEHQPGRCIFCIGGGLVREEMRRRGNAKPLDWGDRRVGTRGGFVNGRSLRGTTGCDGRFAWD